MMDYSGLEDKLTNMLFAPRDLKLISCLAGESADDLSVLTEGLEPDTENLIYMLALSQIGLRRGFDYLPEKTAPRIKGLHGATQIRNIADLNWFEKCISILEDKGISVMLSGDAVFRLVYSPESPRIFNKYDLVFPTDRYDEAVSVLNAAFENDEKASDGANGLWNTNRERFVFCKGAMNDRFIKDESELWSRAYEIDFRKHKVLVPSHEDMLFNSLVIPFGPYALEEDINLRTRRFSDSLTILSYAPDLDLDLVSAKSRAYGLYDTVRFYLGVLSRFAPDRYPRERWESYFSNTDTYGKYLELMINFCEARKEGPEAGVRYEVKSPKDVIRKAKIRACRNKLLEFMEEGTK